MRTIMAVTIEIRENEQTIKTMDLADGRYTIGRDPGADIVLAGKTVSKNHATLVVENETVTVIDNNSANGVFVDGKKIAEKTFKNGFRIEITPFSIRTAGRDQEAEPAPTDRRRSLRTQSRWRSTAISSPSWACWSFWPCSAASCSSMCP